MNIEKLKCLWEQSTDKYGDARKIGTTYQTMYNIIYKQRTFKVDLLEKIAAFYDKPVGYFFNERKETAINSKDKEILYLKGEVEALNNTLKLFSQNKK